MRTAEYPSECPVCGEDILEGEPIISTSAYGYAWMHAACDEDALF